jgi:hypothetical protein
MTTTDFSKGTDGAFPERWGILRLLCMGGGAHPWE